MEEQTKAEGTVSLKKSTIWQIVSGVLGVLLVISIFTSGFGFGNNVVAVPTGNAVGNQPNGGGVPSDIKASADDDPVLGDKNAPVTIIEFSDFQCPFCARFYLQTEKQIIDEYVDTGKVKFVYRDFPLNSIHPDAQPAAEAAECADEQGKFWEYHNILFEKQDEWVGNAEIMLKKYASDLKLDTKKFNDCLDSNKYASEVNKDATDAVASGGQGTPYFVFLDKNGDVTGVVSGAQQFPAFKSAIEKTLAASN